MNVLLDTCALLALARGDLPGRAAAALRSAPEANVAVVSPWEVAFKVAAGKLTSLRSSTALTSSDKRVFASCMLTVIILARLV